MEEQKPKIISPEKYKIRVKLSSAVAVKILTLVNSVLKFLGLKKTKRFWGIVYDSVSKQPLDPVIVKLLYADGREIESCVTDIMGRYGFLAAPGKFKIFARKTNYIFPSTVVTGERDGIFENIYRGEFFTLSGDLEVVAPNIPMDPVNFDWNQQAKKKMDQSYPFFKLFLQRLSATFFWFFLVFGLLSVWEFYPNVPTPIYVIIAIFLVVIILAKLVPESRLFGRVVFRKEIEDMKYLFLELHNAQFPDVSFGKTITHEDGRFLLRANPGKYLLTVSRVNTQTEKVLLGSINIKIGREGVFQSTLIIR